MGAGGAFQAVAEGCLTKQDLKNAVEALYVEAMNKTLDKSGNGNGLKNNIVEVFSKRIGELEREVSTLRARCSFLEKNGDNYSGPSS